MASSNDRWRDGWTVLVAASLSLAAAASVAAGDNQYLDRMDKITAGAGNSAAHNIAVQTINPWPRYVKNDHINVNGRKLDCAYRRYEAGKATPPTSLSTTGRTYQVGTTINVGGAGGGGGGGGGVECDTGAGGPSAKQ